MKIDRPLGPAAQRVLEYRFQHPDHNQTQVARALALSHQRVSEIMNNPRFIRAFSPAAKRHIANMIPKATKKFGELMEQTANLEVSRKVTERVLDTGKVLEPEIKVQINLFESMPVQELKQYISGANQIPNNVIDTDIVSDPESDKI